jgi:hypothetical protein
MLLPRFISDMARWVEPRDPTNQKASGPIGADRKTNPRLALLLASMPIAFLRSNHVEMQQRLLDRFLNQKGALTAAVNRTCQGAEGSVITGTLGGKVLCSNDICA